MVLDGAGDRVECQCDRTAKQALQQVTRHRHVPGLIESQRIISLLPPGPSVFSVRPLECGITEAQEMIHTVQTEEKSAEVLCPEASGEQSVSVNASVAVSSF